LNNIVLIQLKLLDSTQIHPENRPKLTKTDLHNHLVLKELKLG
jgi:hypothetical protein